MEPEFIAPSFESVSQYPSECKARFLAALAKRSEARFHSLKRVHFNEAQQALDDYLLWLSIYSPE